MLDAMAQCPEPVAITGPAGSAALFHCNLMHGCGHNLSQHARWHAYTAFSTVANQARTVDQPGPIWVRGADFTPLKVVADDALVSKAKDPCVNKRLGRDAHAARATAFVSALSGEPSRICRESGTITCQQDPRQEHDGVPADSHGS